MRLTETITIYLTVGAPFAVSYFLRQTGAVSRARLLLQTTLAGLLWPLTLLRMASAHRTTTAPADLRQESASPEHEKRVEEARRHFQNALHAVREAGMDAPRALTEKLERAVYVLRDNAEQYVGLARAAREATCEARPGQRELELFRVAGRRGRDLELAGRCAHRRNVLRLKEHHARARATLLHALAELGETAALWPASGEANARAAERLSLATLKLCGRAVDLLSLLDDAGAATSVAQLLNQECARLRRLQRAAKVAATGSEIGEGSCTAHTHRQSHAPSQSHTTLSSG